MHGQGLSHSDGAKRPNMKNDRETPIKDKPKACQTSLLKGSIKENMDEVSFWGLVKRIEIPKTRQIQQNFIKKNPFNYFSYLNS